MHPQLQRLEYKALKSDLERQMARIVDGLYSERRVVKTLALTLTLSLPHP
jgi:hypothetical protein